MLDKFDNLISNLYDKVLSTRDSICKFKMIKRCKFFLGIKEHESFSVYYYKIISNNKKGVVYTPEEIATYMIENTIDKEAILENPYLKILDPSCGCGNILSPLFDYLKKVYIENLDYINKLHKMNLTAVTVDEHIIKYNIFGIDIDEIALKILGLELYMKSGFVSRNLCKSDFLMDNIGQSFDVIIGNPPYLSTKLIEKSYSKVIREVFSEVYYDKGDLSYCFFKKALEMVKEKYKITFITSRYFMEALHGDNLRDFLISRTNIHKIIDYYGFRPFKSKGVDPVIIFMENSLTDNIEVNRPKKNNDELVFEKIYVNKKHLSREPWRLIGDRDFNIVRKIEEKSSHSLGSLSKTFQGIITGCDKAFIVNEQIIDEFNIERDILKPWIKNSDVKGEKVQWRGMYIVYSNLIAREEDYPNAIAFISRYKDKLIKRRECISESRKWYELQWGREKEIFENTKIIFPYKSSSNRFIIDSGNYFSADVYALVLNNSTNISVEFLNMLLNSSIYEFYFKTFAKKLGGNLYEYYPNNINRLTIPTENTGRLRSEEDLFEFFNLSADEKKYIQNN